MTHDVADVGLLAPTWVGAPVEAMLCDVAVLQAMADVEAALSRAQATVGQIPASAAAAITAAASDQGLDPRALAVAARDAANPVVAFVPAFTAAVARRDPDAARHVHRGSTSQDILDTALMLLVQRAVTTVREDLHAAAAELATKAREHRDTLAAARTLGLHAVPTTFGLRIAGWRALILDADTRLARLLDGGLPVSLGGAAGTMAGYLEPGERSGLDDAPVAARTRSLTAEFANETGLADPVLPWHVRRTPIADTASALCATTGALGKLATDVALLSRTEVGEVAEPQPGGARGRSSAMPQKRNPVLSVLIRSAALQVPALAQILHSALLAEDERASGGWHSEWAPLRECLRLAGGASHAARELVDGLQLHTGRMATNLALTGADIVAERLVPWLAPYVTSPKETLRRAGDTSRRTGQPMVEVLAADPELRGHLSRDTLSAITEPGEYTGAAYALVETALERGPAPEHDPDAGAGPAEGSEAVS